MTRVPGGKAAGHFRLAVESKNVALYFLLDGVCVIHRFCLEFI
ncbi:hypothetical protein HMPREF3038_01680 [Akkermansia sp. KLE1797]|nr:hypothetical protein HMPREF3038_01680 [Akkermansia sp. KLE1797]KXU53881.1 hypothetical protein HMPREF3039_01836 [Akkermansia sp. KLE1798]